MDRKVDVLLVEDNPADALLVRRAFQKAKLSCEIHLAKNGEEAIAYLSGQAGYVDRGNFPIPALVILDLKLPRKSGFDVLSWVRNQPGLKRLPIVVLTSSREMRDVNRAYDLGTNSYIVKVADPLKMNDLINVIHRYWITVNEKPGITMDRQQ